ncbi:branched-chain amino acid ABC transporter permease [Streptomyces sp. NPDC001982]|uniref:branched-chain amino acid ABC transporter permease n=1 Tax=Streptomyces sp. NPDC001982 TaxID=3154405 RepID=UPI0033238632
MDRVFASLVGGVTLGGLYSLIALGLVLAFRVTYTFNFAHGQFMLLGAFILGQWQEHGSGPFPVGLLIALVVPAGVAVLFYVLCLRRTTGLPHWMGLIATFGLASILDGIMSLQYGVAQYQIKIPGLPAGTVTIFGARISSASLLLAGATFAIAGTVAVLIRSTAVGVRFSAAGQDPVLASQGGINVSYGYGFAWALAAALAAIAGCVYGSTNVVNGSMTELALLVFPVILLGGLDSIEGALIGSIIIGIIQGFAKTYLGGQYLDVVTYSVLLLVLLVRPRGLFGTEQVTKI